MPDQVKRILIEFDGQHIHISHPEDSILCFGLLELAKIQISRKLVGPPEEGKGNGGSRIVIPNIIVGHPPS